MLRSDHGSAIFDRFRSVLFIFLAKFARVFALIFDHTSKLETFVLPVTSSNTPRLYLEPVRNDINTVFSYLLQRVMEINSGFRMHFIIVVYS